MTKYIRLLLCNHVVQTCCFYKFIWNQAQASTRACVLALERERETDREREEREKRESSGY